MIESGKSYKCDYNKPVKVLFTLMHYLKYYSPICEAVALQVVNPRRACAAGVTVGVLCVCLSATILALQATRQLMSDTNSFSATRARKKRGNFSDTTAFERYGMKTS